MQTLFEPIGRLFYSRENIRKLEYRVNTAGLYFSAEGFAGLLLTSSAGIRSAGWVSVVGITVITTLCVLVFPKWLAQEKGATL